MTLTTFEMDPASGAATRAGAVLVPFARRWSASWEDLDSTRTLLHVEHPDGDIEELVARVLKADRRIHLVA